MTKVRKGFTLVELLIVIVIIGILAAAMMLSSGSATASAEASNIVTDLRNMKAAALMLYADSMDAFNTGAVPQVAVTMLRTYMDNPSKFDAPGSGTNPYLFTINTAQNKWWVGYNLTYGKKTAEVGQKLLGKAGSVGLYGSTATTATSGLFTGGVGSVWMVAR
jgi:prepilin-type N-terminal cleavage/methylation domain-containing protein